MGPRALEASLSQYLSLGLVLAYVTGTFVTAGAVPAVRIFGFLLFPLACVWFPEAIGDYTGGRVTAGSPASFVWFLGWALLLLPIVIGALLWLQGVPLFQFA